MNLPRRSSILWFIGLFIAGSIALGYDYLFHYTPPLRAVERFESAMSWGDVEAVQSLIAVSSTQELDDLRAPTEEEVRQLLMEPFEKGRVLDLRQRSDDKGTYHYIVIRQKDAQIYAFIVTQFAGKLRVVVSERRTSAPVRYLWEYTWSN
jgi:hypothetical protein